MKLMGIGAFFSSKKSSFRMKKKKSSRTVSPSSGTMSTASFSGDDSNTSKSVLQCNISYPVSSISMGVPDLFGVYKSDGDDKITKRELEIVLRRLGPSDVPTAEELALMVAEIDGDGDGDENISLEELGRPGPRPSARPTQAASFATRSPSSTPTETERYRRRSYSGCSSRWATAAAP